MSEIRDLILANGPLVTESALVDAASRVLDRKWDPDQLRSRADLFSRERFRTRFTFLLDRLGFGEARQ